MRKLTLLLIYLCLISVTKVSANDWPQQKFGVFIHYGWGQTPDDEYGFPITQNTDGTYLQSVNEIADNFNVELFAESMKQINPEYVIFTIWHGGMYPIYPSDVMENWVGAYHRSDRDLIGEVIDAMNELDIDVILYTQPTAANVWSPEEQEKVGFIAKTRYSETFNDFLNEVYAEIVDRYGSRINGFWFDNGSALGAVDKARLRETVLSRMPDAVMISINQANQVTDYGCAEIRKPYMFNTKEGFENIGANDEETWPGLSKSVAFVNDQYWWSVPGSYNLEPEQMYKYNILQAATCTEGGGVSWALGPFPGDDMWNDNVMPTMTDLASRINEVGESIKGTLTSSSYPLSHGTRISELDWGVATQSTDSVYEYIHVLHTPEGTTLTIPAPADGKTFYSGINLRTGNAVSINQTDTEVSITLDDNDSWHNIHSVLKLSTEEPVEAPTPPYTQEEMMSFVPDHEEHFSPWTWDHPQRWIEIRKNQNGGVFTQDEMDILCQNSPVVSINDLDETARFKEQYPDVMYRSGYMNLEKDTRSSETSGNYLVNPQHYIYNADGTPFFGGGCPYFNLASEETREYWLSEAAAQIAGNENTGRFFFIDALAKVGVVNGSDFVDYWGNPIGENYFDHARTMLAELRDRYADKVLIVGNFARPGTGDLRTDFSMQYTHISYIESFEHFGKYVETANKAIPLMQELVAAEKRLFITMNAYRKPIPCDSLTIDEMRAKAAAAMPEIWAEYTETERDELAEMYAWFPFKLAMFLMGAGEKSHLRYVGSLVVRTAGRDLFKNIQPFPEWEMPLGPPLGDGLSNGNVWQRRFEHVDVELDLDNGTSYFIHKHVGNGNNIALLGTASQSSVGNGGAASRAIDGNINGAFSSGSVSTTQNESNPWWQVDFGADFTINEINLMGRIDEGFPDGIANYTLQVINSAGTITYTETFDGNSCAPTNAGGVQGQIVRVQFNGTGVLSLAEVEVFAEEQIQDPCAIALDGFSTIQAEGFCEMSGIQLEDGNDTDGTQHVAYIHNGDYIRFGAIDFGAETANSVTVRVANKNTGGTIEIRSGSSTGELIGSIPVAPTGSWTTWESVSANIEPITGEQDLYFVFTGGAGYLFNLNWIEFSGESTTATQTIELKEGWNLVSLYIQPEPCRDARPCVSTILPNATVVKTMDVFYDSSQPDFLNTLTTIEAGQGYLVYNSIDETIEISGTQMQHIVPPLFEGWNLIGVSSSTAIPTSDFSDATIIKDFESFYEKGSDFSSLSELLPGKAYFVLKE